MNIFEQLNRIDDSKSLRESFTDDYFSNNSELKERLTQTKPSPQLLSLLSQLGLNLPKLVKKEQDEDFSNADTYTLVGTNTTVQGYENKLKNIGATLINEKGNASSYIRDYETNDNGTYVCVKINEKGKCFFILVDRRTMIEKINKSKVAEEKSLPEAKWVFEIDGDIYEGFTKEEECRESVIETAWERFVNNDEFDRNDWNFEKYPEAAELIDNEDFESCIPDEFDPNDYYEIYVYQDFGSLNQSELAEYLADIFEETYKYQSQYYKRFAGDIETFLINTYDFPRYQYADIEKASFNIAWNMVEILEERCNIKLTEKYNIKRARKLKEGLTIHEHEPEFAGYTPKTYLPTDKQGKCELVIYASLSDYDDPTGDWDVNVEMNDSNGWLAFDIDVTKGLAEEIDNLGHIYLTSYSFNEAEEVCANIRQYFMEVDSEDFYDTFVNVLHCDRAGVEKLWNNPANKVDDSLIESQRVVKKKKLIEGLEGEQHIQYCPACGAMNKYSDSQDNGSWVRYTCRACDNTWDIDKPKKVGTILKSKLKED